MSNDLMMANVVMLFVAAMAGTVYAYMLRNTSPYAPSVLDYLGDEGTSKGNGRAAL